MCSHQVWKHYLRFRKSSQHAQCNTCFQLRRLIDDKRGDLQSKWKAAQDCHIEVAGPASHESMCSSILFGVLVGQELKAHYRDTYLDRQIYWGLRLASRCQGEVLTVIIDSMDKAKFAWPRWPFAVRPHAIADLRRPRAVFTAAWAHGYCCNLFMASEQVLPLQRQNRAS